MEIKEIYEVLNVPKEIQNYIEGKHDEIKLEEGVELKDHIKGLVDGYNSERTEFYKAKLEKEILRDKNKEIFDNVTIPLKERIAKGFQIENPEKFTIKELIDKAKESYESKDAPDDLKNKIKDKNTKIEELSKLVEAAQEALEKEKANLEKSYNEKITQRDADQAFSAIVTGMTKDLLTKPNAAKVVLRNLLEEKGYRLDFQDGSLKVTDKDGADAMNIKGTKRIVSKQDIIELAVNLSKEAGIYKVSNAGGGAGGGGNADPSTKRVDHGW